MPQSPKLIAIAGASGSGKSTLAALLQRALQDAVSLTTDAYYRDLSHLPPAQRLQNNFDHPDALEHELLIHHLTTLVQGQPAAIPRYDFTQHIRQPGTLEIHPKPYVILEGLHALHWEALRNLAHARIFIDLDHQTCLARRIERDVRERGRTEESVRQQYQQTVQPMFDTHVLPAKDTAHLVLHGASPPEHLLQQALTHLQHPPINRP